MCGSFSGSQTPDRHHHRRRADPVVERARGRALPGKPHVLLRTGDRVAHPDAEPFDLFPGGGSDVQPELDGIGWCRDGGIQGLKHTGHGKPTAVHQRRTAGPEPGKDPAAAGQLQHPVLPDRRHLESHLVEVGDHDDRRLAPAGRDPEIPRAIHPGPGPTRQHPLDRLPDRCFTARDAVGLHQRLEHRFGLPETLGILRHRSREREQGEKRERCLHRDPPDPCRDLGRQPLGVGGRDGLHRRARVAHGQPLRHHAAERRPSFHRIFGSLALTIHQDRLLEGPGRVRHGAEAAAGELLLHHEGDHDGLPPRDHALLRRGSAGRHQQRRARGSAASHRRGQQIPAVAMRPLVQGDRGQHPDPQRPGLGRRGGADIHQRAVDGERRGRRRRARGSGGSTARRPPRAPRRPTCRW